MSISPLRIPPRDRNVSAIKGTWDENITQPDVLENFSAKDLINRFLSTNLIARPLLNSIQVSRTLATVLSSRPGQRPFDLIESVKCGFEARVEFNKARVERIKENWGVR